MINRGVCLTGPYDGAEVTHDGDVLRAFIPAEVPVVYINEEERKDTAYAPRTFEYKRMLWGVPYEMRLFWVPTHWTPVDMLNHIYEAVKK